jgi:hypothetical protein
LWTLLTLDDLELDAITFGQGLESVATDRTEVNEHVGAALTRDEAESLCVVEPLHGARNARHVTFLSPDWG